MAKISDIKDHRYERQSSAEAIKVLEDFLDLAKNGEVVAVAVAAVRFDGATMDGASSAPNLATLVGASAVLHHKLVRQYD